jgi:bifunctional non-homologous end joining protein LigD
VEPQVVVQVGFHEWTVAGVLRAPRYQGLRPDKRASEVLREAQ